jgi:hypothetical protein
MFSLRYELGLYIPEDGILHCHRRQNMKSHSINLLGSVAEM